MVSLLKCNIAGLMALVSLISFSFASRLLFDSTSDDIFANIGRNQIPFIPVQRSHWPDHSSREQGSSTSFPGIGIGGGGTGSSTGYSDDFGSGSSSTGDSDDFGGGGLSGGGGSLDGPGNGGGSYGDWVPKFGGGGGLDGAGRNGEFNSGSTDAAIESIPSTGDEEEKRGSSQIRTLPVINQPLSIGDDTISSDREGKRGSTSQISTVPVINKPLPIGDGTISGDIERKRGSSPYHTLPINEPFSIGDVEGKRGSQYHTLPINEPFSVGDETISGSVGGYKMKRDDPNENK